MSMKKFLTAALILLLTVSVSAVAEPSIDLSSLSIDELVNLNRLISHEIDSRMNTAAGSIYPGIYVVGESITAGTYKISQSEAEPESLVCVFHSMEVYDAYRAGELSDREASAWYHVLGETSPTTIVTIKEGQVLVINIPRAGYEETTHGPFAIEVVSEFWVP